MRVLIAENRRAICWALRTALREQVGLELVGEASNSGDLMTQAASLHPDVILLAWELPGEPPARLVPALRSIGDPAVVVIIGQSPLVSRAALATGAQEYVCTSCPPDELLSTLRRLVH
jgi:DNA-binding NarL/FixJ family response regulator